MQAARRASLNFTADRDDLCAVARICRLTEGLPLGIELAASWVRVLSCAEIAQEIARSLDFLSTAARNVPERHRSLRAVFDHSWQLLGDEELRVLRRLSVFQGSFRREAAEAVTGASLAILAALMSKSLLRRSEAGRYDLHSLVRQYAADRLNEQPGEAHAARVRFSQYYLDFLCERERLLQSGEQGRAVAEISQEIGNLRLAWQWAAEHRDLALLRRAAWPYWYYYALRNLFAEGEAAFRGAIEALGAAALRPAWPGDRPPGPPAAHAGATTETVLGYLQALCAVWLLGQLRVEEARELLSESLAQLRDGSDSAALADALRMLGQTCWFAGDFAEGLRYYIEAYALAQETRHEWLMATIPTFAGRIEYELGHHDESYRWLANGLAASRRLGNPRIIAANSIALSATAIVMGRGAEMEPLLREALQLTRKSGDRFMAGAALEHLAALRQVSSDTAEAGRLFDESIAIYREVDDRSSLTRALVAAGHCALDRDDEGAAGAFFVEALQIASRAHLYPTALDALAGIAKLRMRHGIDASTLAIVSHVLQHPAAAHEGRTRAERLWAASLPGLAPEQIAAAEAAGRPECCAAIVSQALA